jgi:deoxyribonuclease V
MKARELHRWDVTPQEARRIQEELRGRVILKDDFVTKSRKHGDRQKSIRRVAGADLAFDFLGGGTSKGRAIAGVIVYSFPELREIERAWAERPLEFPYVPGLLSFRELPALLAAISKLRTEPDVIFCDAQGYAHPRRFGLASHLGVLLDCATVGCAKSRLIGEHKEPGRAAGSWAPLEDAGEKIGAVVRTRADVKPIYVSTGHRVALPTAIKLVLDACDGYRIPKPTREADHFVEQLKRRKNS